MPTLQTKTIAKRSSEGKRLRRRRRKQDPQSFQQFLAQCRQVPTEQLRSQEQELHDLQLEIAACAAAVGVELARREGEPP